MKKPRRIWTTDLHLEQNVGGIVQRISMAVEHLSGPEPTVNGNITEWVEKKACDALVAEGEGLKECIRSASNNLENLLEEFEDGTLEKRLVRALISDLDEALNGKGK